ncbi:hypothetical protein FACS1894187_16640 [Synergistales bacterium]|nr:hypothetical protein FACS1894187_16640 [Synergistales bacterium]
MGQKEDMTRIYLDTCCYNRPFDDQSQIRIYLETEAKLYIQEKIKKSFYILVWSYMLDFENLQNPYEDTRNAIQAWKNIAKIHCHSSEEILSVGKVIEKLGILPKDALHLACAVQCDCEYFITTDVRLLKKKVDNIVIVNPINFIMETEEKR